MANFIGAIEQFNPYIQQIPTDAYTKVGMFKEQQYQVGVQKVQETIDNIAGLDIANEGGRNYLRARVDDLTKNLNKYNKIDFANAENVSQLVALAKPLYQDENIVTDVINTGIYRNWAKQANEAFKAGKMELGQFDREQEAAGQWLNSESAGATYTGRQSPNTATKKDLLDKIIKYKKDGLEKSEYVYDINYDKDKPYYVKKTDKYYSEAEFNNFVSEAVMDTSDREMLMNEHWYENKGVPTQLLQTQDLLIYQSKINSNISQINHLTEMAKLQTGDDKLRTEQTVQNLKDYNDQLTKGKVKQLQTLNLDDPQARDVLHRDLSESRFMDSLGILTDEVRKEELTKNEQWFTDKQEALEAAKNGAKAAPKAKPGSIEAITDEVSLYTPVDPTAPKTELSLNVIQQGWSKKNEEINGAMNSLIGKLQENGVDVSQFLAKNADGSDAWDQVQVGNKAGAAMNVPRFKDSASKAKFYNLVAGLNYAYTKEAEDGHLDNQSFTKWVKNNVAGYNDSDPNSKFSLDDKMVSDALNTIKGTSALLPKMESLFSDKSVVKAMSDIDVALRNKKKMANAYREAIFKSNSLKASEQDALKKMSDDDLLSNSFFLDKDLEQKRAGSGKKLTYATVQEADGTFSIYQDVFKDEANAIQKKLRGLAPESGTEDIGLGEHIERRKLAGGYKDKRVAENALRAGGQVSLYSGISKESLDKAEAFVKQTYSYVQENLNTTVTNLKEDKPAYAAVQDALSLYMNRAKLQATPEDLQIDGNIDPKAISGITDVEVLGATVSNSQDIFNPNPMYEVTFKASVPDKDGKITQTTLNGRVSLKSFLATSPNYKTSAYAQYFAPALYSEQDAYDRISATVNPLEGSEASYLNRKDIRPVYNTQDQSGKNKFRYDDAAHDKDYTYNSGTAYDWETIPVDKDGKQTMISYQVVSLGQNTNLGNIKNKDGQQYAPGKYYIKIRVPSSNGQPKVIFLKKPNGESLTFESASYAHYTLRDLILNNPEIKMDEIDPSTNQPNYLTTNGSTLRGILNSQLSYNGYSKLETVKIKDALGKEQEKLQAKELQLVK